LAISSETLDALDAAVKADSMVGTQAGTTGFCVATAI
jgi:hypothetical protein